MDSGVRGKTHLDGMGWGGVGGWVVGYGVKALRWGMGRGGVGGMGRCGGDGSVCVCGEQGCRTKLAALVTVPPCSRHPP